MKSCVTTERQDRVWKEFDKVRKCLFVNNPCDQKISKNLSKRFVRKETMRFKYRKMTTNTTQTKFNPLHVKCRAKRLEKHFKRTLSNDFNACHGQCNTLNVYNV